MNPLEDLRIGSAVEEIRALDVFRSIQWVESIDSTNRTLTNQIRDLSVAPPALLVANRQTEGMGRGGNRWFSPPGCLMFSMGLPIAVDLTLLPIAAGILIAKTVEPLCRVTPRVKWPNDVFLENKKVGGILINAIPDPHSFGDSATMLAIIGVGLNCQVDFSRAEPETQSKAGSLHQFARSKSSEDLTPPSLLLRFLSEWKAFLLKSSEEVSEWIHQEWPCYSLLDQKWVTVSSAGFQESGHCVGIDRDGALKLIDHRGAMHRIIAGTITQFEDVRQ